jgi:hypothetical protein
MRFQAWLDTSSLSFLAYYQYTSPFAHQLSKELKRNSLTNAKWKLVIFDADTTKLGSPFGSWEQELMFNLNWKFYLFEVIIKLFSFMISKFVSDLFVRIYKI